MNRPLMRKATALWLVNHTDLTWEQIGEFCGLHPLEIRVLSEGNMLQESDPIAAAQLTREEIQRCEEDPTARLQLHELPEMVLTRSKKTRAKYTPLSKRSDIPNAILWLIRHYPHLSDQKICTLLPTTKTMVKNIREGRHWNSKGMTPKDPVLLGLCQKEELDTLTASS